MARVIAGALAKQLLGPEVTVRAAVERAAGISASDPTTWDWSLREQSGVGCPDLVASAAIEEEVARRRGEGDSAGGVVYLEVLGVPAGWGEPVFDKLHAVLGHALLSINAVKGVEFGDDSPAQTCAAASTTMHLMPTESCAKTAKVESLAESATADPSRRVSRSSLFQVLL